MALVDHLEKFDPPDSGGMNIYIGHTPALQFELTKGKKLLRLTRSIRERQLLRE